MTSGKVRIIIYLNDEWYCQYFIVSGRIKSIAYDLEYLQTQNGNHMMQGESIIRQRMLEMTGSYRPLRRD